MSTLIYEISVFVLGIFLAVGTIVFLIGAMSDNPWGWREKRIKMGGIAASVSGIILVLLFLIFPNI